MGRACLFLSAATRRPGRPAVAGEFWLPSYRMKRPVHGGFARLMGALCLVGGIALLVGRAFPPRIAEDSSVYA